MSPPPPPLVPAARPRARRAARQPLCRALDVLRCWGWAQALVCVAPAYARPPAAVATPRRARPSRPPARLPGPAPLTAPAPGPAPRAEVIVAPAAVHIPYVQQHLRKDFSVSAQNCWVGKGGAFTGELRRGALLACWLAGLLPLCRGLAAPPSLCWRCCWQAGAGGERLGRRAGCACAFAARGSCARAVPAPVAATVLCCRSRTPLPAWRTLLSSQR